MRDLHPRTNRRRGDRAREAARDVFAQLRESKRDPAHGGRAAQIRGTKNAAHQRVVHDRTGERPDRTVFTNEILPGLTVVPVPEITAATRLCGVSCSLVRLGEKIPHPRHWETLRAVAGSR
jgi:hypothetical protein